MGYRIGIDVGSKTVKVVVIDDECRIVESAYRRHRGELLSTLRETVHLVANRLGDAGGPVAVTGSAGIAFAQALGLPFVQEVSCITRAVRELHPQADCIIELGGEDAKVVYLTGGLEQRMNATCAGGTGGFIETMAHLVGVRTGAFNNLAMGSSTSYPIASRCAVFATADVRPLLNAGAKPSDVAASALDAVVQQTLGGLACGRPIRGTVVFLGGPLERIPALVMRFRKALGLDHRTGIKPRDAHLYTAVGAAICSEDPVPSAGGGRGADCPSCTVGSLEEGAGGAFRATLPQIERMIAGCPGLPDDLGHLPPLFASDEERRAFFERHDEERLPRRPIEDAEPPLFLGIDAGSTTVKHVAVDGGGFIVASDYRPVEGDVLRTAVAMLADLRTELERVRPGRRLDLPIAHATVTGYGEELLKAALGVDSGVVETVAHLRGAQAAAPDVAFLLDIGGQDMKALWVRDGRLSDAVLNEACSSGCGSFIEGAARSVRLSPAAFSREALEARAPLDLGARCTVFMTSRIRHAQKIGAARGDVAAGAAYSVIRNVTERLIGRGRLGDLPALARHGAVVVQGGAFKSDAVLRAFEKEAGIHAVRPRDAHLMGAYGCALIARERFGGMRPARGEGGMTECSKMLPLDGLRSVDPARSRTTCPGCPNRCSLSVVDFGNGRASIAGNRCTRAWEAIGLEPPQRRMEGADAPLNAVSVHRGLLDRYDNVESRGPRGALHVGILSVLGMQPELPFWHTLLEGLGFSIVLPDDAGLPGDRIASAESIPSESVCYAAKLAHARLCGLARAGADVALAPHFERGNRCAVTCGYTALLGEGEPPVPVASPGLSRTDAARLTVDGHDRDVLYGCLADLAEPYEPLGREEFVAALERAAKAQEAHGEAVARAACEALAWIHDDPARRGVVVDCRPYLLDAELMNRIDEILVELGVAVVPARFLPESGRSVGDGTDEVLPRALWKRSDHLEAALRAVRDDSQLELVAVRAFGCMYDAVSFDESRELAASWGRPLTELVVDEMVDVAHLRIRLRTLVEMMGHDSGGLDGDGFPRLSGTVDAAMPGGTRSGEGLASPTPVSPFLDGGDVALARMAPTHDLCFTVKALAARVARETGNATDPNGAFLSVPRPCRDCLERALPYEVKRVAGFAPEMEWSDDPAVWEGPGCSRAIPERRAGRPLVGLVGNPLLVFDPLMNEDIAALLGRLGCEVAWPDPAKLLVDDVRYASQLDEFAASGVDHVIYLLSFGCLKGHVQARGASRWFRERYPDMPVTVIDYDPESSALNRENRIRLAVSPSLR